MNGWICIHRKLIDWEWYHDANTCRLFLHLLLKANYEQRRWQGIELLPGQLITGRAALSEELRLSEQEIRTSLSKLKSTSEVAIKSTNKYSIITICKWEDYQDGPTSNQPAKQPSKHITINQQSTTANNNNNGNKENNNVLLSQVDKSTLDQTQIRYFEIAFNFWELVRKNMHDLHVNSAAVERATYGGWVDPIRQLFEIDTKSIEEVRTVFKFLREDEFWGKQVLSTAKLRKKNKNGITYFDELLIQSKNGKTRRFDRGVNRKKDYSLMR